MGMINCIHRETQHRIYLENLLKNFNQINVDKKTIEWLCIEPMYFFNKTTRQKKMCDIIGGLYDGHGLAIELKGDYAKKHKAVEQLKYGEILLKRLGYEDIIKKFVVYTPEKYLVWMI
jgi:hypothetical protein